MSAPDTNLQTQEHEHKPALTGIRLSLGLVALLLLVFVSYTVFQGGEPETAERQVIPGVGIEDTSTGEIVAPPPGG
ncbi:hypothetical protein [Tropicibacter naphthalenivorans]|uniref:Uncharacterized protein n=1 Tax=Tropicibacter naphthalenivorans TaxID=441103 RepID=A0A0P1G4D7_9RHOB|nr:hypothetical protein [Tropicibacter naphthalenivorans]CUH76658.1 hypothetical protein TRN7648_01052 [Tropicibacter naphthalenivorans]SMC64245.1 hypothetical protein SAMN04488093_102566 [Tropicibacter naphthalenivorans]